MLADATLLLVVLLSGFLLDVHCGTEVLIEQTGSYRCGRRQQIIADYFRVYGRLNVWLLLGILRGLEVFEGMNYTRSVLSGARLVVIDLVDDVVQFLVDFIV